VSYNEIFACSQDCLSSVTSYLIFELASTRSTVEHVLYKTHTFR